MKLFLDGHRIGCVVLSLQISFPINMVNCKVHFGQKFPYLFFTFAFRLSSSSGRSTRACIDLNKERLSLLSVPIVTFKTPDPVSSEIFEFFIIWTNPVVDDSIHVTFVG